MLACQKYDLSRSFCQRDSLQRHLGQIGGGDHEVGEHGYRGILAEMVDDRVRTRDEQRGMEQAWREWEIELGPAAPEDADACAAFFDAVTVAAYAKGAREASSDSKLARALGV